MRFKASGDYSQSNKARIPNDARPITAPKEVHGMSQAKSMPPKTNNSSEERPGDLMSRNRFKVSKLQKLKKMKRIGAIRK